MLREREGGRERMNKTHSIRYGSDIAHERERGRERRERIKDIVRMNRAATFHSSPRIFEVNSFSFIILS